MHRGPLERPWRYDRLTDRNPGMRHTIFGACLFVAAFFAAPSAAFASDSGSGATAIETSQITVTALRRPLPEDAVPASLTVLTGQQLQARSVRSFADLAMVEPSLQISAYQGESQIFLRGIGAVTFLGGFDSSVAVNLDGVYLGRPSAAASAMFDLDRIEILKGPQGTLYGRNATGGAINLVSRGPTKDWHADGRVAFGNYARADAFASIAGPLTDRLAMRLSVGSSNHAGYTRLITGRNASGKDRVDHAEDQHDQSARLRLDWQARSNLKLTLSADVSRADDRAVVFHFAGPGYGNNPVFLARLAQGIVGPVGARTIASSVLPFNRPLNWGLMARAELDLGSAILSTTAAYRQTHPKNFDDLSNSTVLAETQYKEEDARQWSVDVALHSMPSATLTYWLGASHYIERNTVRNEYFFPYLVTLLGGTGSADCCLLRANGTQHTLANALFGEVGGAILPRTTVTVGGRWTRERRRGTNLLDFTGLQTLNNAVLAPAEFRSFTPKAVIDHTFSEYGHIFVSAARGYKAGGFNLGSAQNTPYAPEKIWSYELGAKFAGPNWKIEASAFHYDYRDLQVQDVDANSVLIRNAATARVDGVELGLRGASGPRFRFAAQATWLNARFSRYATINTKQPGLGVQDLAGNPLPHAPRWRVLGYAERDFALHGGAILRLRGDASWQDRTWFTAFRDARATQAAWWWLKARATWIPAHARWQAAVFVDNLTNTRAFTNVSITGDLDASRALGNMAPPRTFGLEFGFSL
ncbi:TonB-dependent receptor [Novosphingobium sp. EMRT-2]|nr:TonB-dependent receptor [Novosphingobium sp. EMRT-2]